MRYTLWLDGHLLGETRFEHRNPSSRQRMGVLHPTPHGMDVLPGLCGFLVAAAAVKQVFLTHGVSDPDHDPDGALQLLETTPEGSRFTGVVRSLARLEIRQAGGERAAFHTVIVTDVRELARFNQHLDVATIAEPRFIISATPMDVHAMGNQLNRRMRVRLEPN